MLYERVLITGANGLLGQELVIRMSRFGEYDLLATARDANSRFPSASCGYTPLDITDFDTVSRLFHDFTPTVVINCAAMTQVDRCEEERDTCWRVNAEAVEHLARQCRSVGARLLQLSTDFVFDGKDGPYRENDRPNPVNFYGRSKLAGENAIRNAGLDKWAIVRTALVYGTGCRLRRSNIALWVIHSLQEGKTIHVVEDQIRTPTYVGDLALGLERTVRHGKTGVYHISGSEMMSVYDFARHVATVFELDHTRIKRITSEELSERADRPPKTGFIILKASSEIGFRPRSIHEGLQDLAKRLGLPSTAPSC